MYEICYKDIPVFKIEMDKTNRGIVKILDEKHIPFDIYLEENDDIDTRLNNIENFNSWCSERILSLDRKYAKEILNSYGFTQRTTTSERAKIGIATRCLSLNDCFWLRNDGEPVSWKDVNLFENSLENSVFEIALSGSGPTVTNSELVNPDVTTGGKAPKAWLRSGNDFFLLKGDLNDSVVKEVEASQILTLLGINNLGYEYDKFNEYPVSKCRCFTNERMNLVKADYFAIWCMNHDKNIMDYVYKYKDSFDKMNLADYLIGNNDEHAQNWGFLYDNEMNIISMNPLMDYDHAFESVPESQCLPVMMLGENKTQLEMAVTVLQEHPDWINKNVDLSRFKYGGFVNKRLDILYREVKNSGYKKESEEGKEDNDSPDDPDNDHDNPDDPGGR